MRSWKAWVLPSLMCGLVACDMGPSPNESRAPGTPEATAGLRAEVKAPVAALQPKELLGRLLFFDKRLSEPPGQACASCHHPSTGWMGPDTHANGTGGVHEGAVPGRFGNRKPPSSAYATRAPIFQPAIWAEGVFVGGSFWDGRATGEELGTPATDQAQLPFLNPVEQNNPNEAAVVAKVCTGPYAAHFLLLYGWTMCQPGQVARAYDNIARAIAAYEASSEMNPFSSKYDAYLAGRARLTDQELRGLGLFEGKALCSSCHLSQRGARGEPPLFTDHTYANLGVPRNPLNPWYEQREFNPRGWEWTDQGLGAFLQTRPEWRRYARENLGKQKVPTLRNVDKRPNPAFVKAYMHNGYFKDLKSVVHFYNTRDALPVCRAEGSREQAVPGVDCWPSPEVKQNVDTSQMGNLGLTSEEEDALVAFLRTLSDGYVQR
ncbi:cytochrome c [Cystobacter fuscus]|uniref:Cytochrome c n=1 Tax=Cystobacter fuscus TaxID=43 RepID=A0A250IVH3_9BACT|nr:cytochrome c peroxidase [Cystobacter fuscus]ATB35232.1 cytochrome c [Cystobacter fuscus]